MFSKYLKFIIQDGFSRNSIIFIICSIALFICGYNEIFYQWISNLITFGIFCGVILTGFIVAVNLLYLSEGNTADDDGDRMAILAVTYFVSTVVAAACGYFVTALLQLIVSIGAIIAASEFDDALDDHAYD